MSNLVDIQKKNKNVGTMNAYFLAALLLVHSNPGLFQEINMKMLIEVMFDDTLHTNVSKRKQNITNFHPFPYER